MLCPSPRAKNASPSTFEINLIKCYPFITENIMYLSSSSTNTNHTTYPTTDVTPTRSRTRNVVTTGAAVSLRPNDSSCQQQFDGVGIASADQRKHPVDRLGIMGNGASSRPNHHHFSPNYHPPFLANTRVQQQDHEHKEGMSLLPGSKWWHGVFIFSLISMFVCIESLWAPSPLGLREPTDIIATSPFSDGCREGMEFCICPRATICADDLLSMILLTIARSSAWFNYPLYMMMFLSKAKYLGNMLQKTMLRCWINFSDLHHVHSIFGIIVGLESVSHTAFHILRWARRKEDIQLLWSSKTGITGMIAIVVTPLIILPMVVPFLKRRISFEWRKSMHYLCFVWAGALMFHAPQRIFWLIGVPLFIYLADKLVQVFSVTHLTESAYFQLLGEHSCIVSFENPPGFGRQNSAYVYIMLPWISKYQFHAFTVFPCTSPNHSSVCINQCGDWTKRLIDSIKTPTHKPAFVVGPFLSPFSSPAMDSENLIAVASGIGVTPAISLIKQYSNTSRRLNLIWICRDAALIEHFLQNVDFGCDGYILVFYTGKDRNLVLGADVPPNIFIFNSRPNLERAIGGIILSIATGVCPPEKLCESKFTSAPARVRCKLLLSKALSFYSMDQLYEQTVMASNHRFTSFNPSTATIDKQGVLYLMKQILGGLDYQLFTNQIARCFDEIDMDGDGRLDRVDFEDLISLMRDGESRTTVDVESNEFALTSDIQRSLLCEMFVGDSSNDDSETGNFGNAELGTINRHLQGGGKFSSKNWKMLYCGGSQPVLDALKDVKRKFGVGLVVEKFDW